MTELANEPVAVLLSGGLDSAILAGQCVRRGHPVHPLYIDCGLVWQAAELFNLRRFLAAIAQPNLSPLSILSLPVADLYGEHWSRTGHNIPDATTPDEAVYLPGRNPLLLVKAAVWCQLRGVKRLALGPLATNPFPDATPEFFTAFEQAMNLAMSGALRIERPFATLHKNDVMQLGRELPLELTFSCIAPVGNRHCGRCNKCAERQTAFREAGLNDGTKYDFRS